ncbi:hypothetical protein G4B88_029198 [Cannabis sativa]|uniref:RNase H type-1 domain-containing protein n=1 Tax=Cannabis sativa TaxID=3483 RepID=A0A7J6H1W6_CANSA|nr:hypothetical protein G4B88_029198 [Cannabis sativa]
MERVMQDMSSQMALTKKENIVHEIGETSSSAISTISEWSVFAFVYTHKKVNPGAFITQMSDLWPFQFSVTISSRNGYFLAEFGCAGDMQVPIINTHGVLLITQILFFIGFFITVTSEIVDSCKLGWVTTPPTLGVVSSGAVNCSPREKKIMGIGGIIRDSKGLVIAAILKLIHGLWSVTEIEAKVVSACLHWASDLGISIHQLETDSLIVANYTNNYHDQPSRHNDSICDINYQLTFFLGASLNHISCYSNVVAHGLVRFALRVDSDYVWRANIPGPIHAIVEKELIH